MAAVGPASSHSWPLVLAPSLPAVRGGRDELMDDVLSMVGRQTALPAAPAAPWCPAAPPLPLQSAGRAQRAAYPLLYCCGPAQADGASPCIHLHMQLEAALRRCWLRCHASPSSFFLLQVMGYECVNFQMPMLPTTLINLASRVCPF